MVWEAPVRFQGGVVFILKNQSTFGFLLQIVEHIAERVGEVHFAPFEFPQLAIGCWFHVGLSVGEKCLGLIGK